MDAMKHELYSKESTLSGAERRQKPTDNHYHFGCEYDPLRGDEDALSTKSMDLGTGGDPTHQIEINGQVVKSTFIGYVIRLKFK